MTTPQEQPGDGSVYGQAGHFGQVGGYVPPPPPKERHPLPWLLGGAAVVVIAVVVVLIIVLTGGTDTSSAKSTNDAVVKALNDKDVKTLQGLLCKQNVLPPEISQGLTLGKDLADVHAEAKGDPAENGDTATSTVNLTITALGQTLQTDVQLTYRHNGGSWCVDDLKANVG